MNIYLIGFMGAGKSTIGAALAHRLGYDWVDTDQLIEQQEQQSISNIFAEKGEIYFRQLEKNILEQNLATKTQLVVATGGGMPCFFDNLATMQQQGITIYLDVQPAILAQRLWQQKAQRPIIANCTTFDELLYSIEQRLAQRQIYYEQAQYRIDAEQNIEQIIVTISYFIRLKKTR
ncbi:MAG: shikimate kinase [Chitinophagales bacterium]|nr:shikimate kinase [Chitinophagales bacterium]HNI45239.1 shikimate kinase [Chitinophagales bacterium]